MIIQINEDWRIKTDPMNWILQTSSEKSRRTALERAQKTGKPGSDGWTNDSYHTSPQSALTHFWKKRVRALDITISVDNAEMLRSELAKIEAEIMKACAPLDLPNLKLVVSK